MRFINTLVFPALLSIVSAQQETVSMFLPGADIQTLYASRIGSDSSATTYFVGCPVNVDETNCGYPMAFSVTQGPKTMHYVASVPSQYTADLNCKLEDTTSASCLYSLGGPEVSSTGIGEVTSVEVSGAEVASVWLPVTIVTDAKSIQDVNIEEYASYTSATASAESAARTQILAAPSTSIQVIPGSTQVFAASTQVVGGSTVVIPTSTGVVTSTSKASAIPLITGSAGWVVGGVAAAVAICVM